MDKRIILAVLFTGIRLAQTVFADCPDTVHPEIKGFGPDCRYRCYCKDNVQCDVTGECPDGCLFGWMGPGCQYRNVASTFTNARQHYSANDPAKWAKQAVDGDVSTCSKTGPNGSGGSTQQWWELELSSEIYIVGLVITIPESETAKFKGYSVEIGNTTSDLDVCYKHGPNADGDIVMKVNCVRPIVGKFVRIKLAETEPPSLTLCEVEIFGGRLVSFNKFTSMESTLKYDGFRWESSHAVDGSNIAPPGKSQDVTCAATKDYYKHIRELWWNVTLDTAFDIQGINFFGRLDHIGQSKAYTIKVGDSNPQTHPVYTDNNPSDSNDAYNPKSTNFTLPVPGSVVRVERSGNIFVICEFEVFAECPPGRCGWECNETCMCSSQTTGQHKILGACPHGCSGRWSGGNGKCNIECPDTKWGPYCNNTCGQCKINDSCSVSEGFCPNSCKPGWIPPLCVHECNDRYFGQDCNFTCGYCKNELVCNKETGECATGCMPGYKPFLCIENCDAGWYGDDCRKICGKCRNGGICDHVTGNCPDGCEAGYQGQNCMQPCDPGWHGTNCFGKCGNCKNGEPCNNTNGECNSGCSPGWLTSICNISCESGVYGDGCNETCGYCLTEETDDICSHEDGSCLHGCDSGFYGTVCKTECEDGVYGKNCVSKCGSCAGNVHCNRTTGACPHGCVPDYKGIRCDVREGGSSTELIVGAIIGVFVLMIGAFIVFIVFRRRSNGHKRQSVANRTPKISDQYLTDIHGPAQKTHAVPKPDQDPVYCNTDEKEPIDENSVKISHLRALISRAKRDPTFLHSEFQELPYGLTNDASEAKAVEYKLKNRYKDLYPYNMNRVTLPEIPGESDSTYINASYINGYDTASKYIAAQGALETTVEDIWRMVWSKQISVIVMLTNCFELGRLKCVQYWSNEGSKVYADISTDVVSVEEYTDFKIRTFHCTQVESGERRTVLQFHYTAWPDKDVPDTALSLVQFWRKVRGHEKAKRLPWMVHCSAGVGRTGTFIALDYLYDQDKSEGKVNIKGGVYNLRQQRLNMVQTKEQYVYLHESVAETLDPLGAVCEKEQYINVHRKLFTEEGIPKPVLHEEFENICEDTEAGTEAAEAIYRNIADTDSASSKDHSDAMLPENIPKSRDIQIVPDNLHRPRLGMAVKGRNDFINAVFVSTYRQKDRMILTQFPLRETVVDFARMVWEFNIKTVVLLEDSHIAEGVYWPSSEVPKAIGPLKAELVHEKKEEFYISRTIRYSFLLNDNEQQKNVHMFHFRAWPSYDKIPKNTASMLRLISDIENEDTGKESSPLVIQCLNGAKKSGLLCVLCCVLERMKTDREVAIAETVRLVRLRRKQVIDNIEQYKYCYDIVREYIENHDVYANVM
ncbi:uncharacterized protein LOC123556442 isoform X2 [Mercenaria mercenaria]|uniref:uncharacterized protein LOC123556442 isoform X2 n=1 Tax=Mercenaria mercenaria TaxID=6596 RepID=UPI00234F91FD|nr:uncharacterized protein LOC123556442 isoform X2 [Mercenaria mercenaria]